MNLRFAGFMSVKLSPPGGGTTYLPYEEKRIKNLRHMTMLSIQAVTVYPRAAWQNSLRTSQVDTIGTYRQHEFDLRSEILKVI